MAEKTMKISVNLPEHLYSQLEKAASVRGTSLSEEIRRALVEHLVGLQDDAGFQQQLEAHRAKEEAMYAKLARTRTRDPEEAEDAPRVEDPLAAAATLSPAG